MALAKTARKSTTVRTVTSVVITESKIGGRTLSEKIAKGFSWSVESHSQVAMPQAMRARFEGKSRCQVGTNHPRCTAEFERLHDCQAVRGTERGNRRLKLERSLFENESSRANDLADSNHGLQVHGAEARTGQALVHLHDMTPWQRRAQSFPQEPPGFRSTTLRPAETKPSYLRGMPT
jgi:hypothetical protein